VQNFLDEIKESDPDDFAAVLAGLVRLRTREYHKPPLSKPVGEGLFELRHLGKLNTRMLYFFAHGRRIIIVHGIRKKTRALLPRDRRVALDRMRDWIARNAE
jgi:phage-related protein